MSDPIRAALERLVEAVEDYEPIWGGFPESALAEARAALAEQPGAEKVEQVAQQVFEAMRFSGATSPNPPEWVSGGNSLMQDHARDVARAILACWGRPAPQPPAEGEVGELVGWLRSTRLRAQQMPVPEEAADPWKDALIDALVCAFLLNEEELLEEPDDRVLTEDDFGDNEDPKRWARYQRWLNSDQRQALHDLISWEVQLAKDPLINSLVHPTPVPVSDEPWKRDGWCDERGRCWWTANKPGPLPPTWWMVSIPQACTDGIMLPAHALPMPQGEVE